MSFQQGLSRLYNFLAGGPATGLFFFLLPLLFYAGAAPFRDLYGIEARNALFAREMLENGISFIPHLLGRPYPDYPPLYFLLEYIFSLPAGRVTTLTAVLPSALSAAGIVWLTWHWTSKASRHLAVCACLILAASPGFWLKASHATVDMLLAFETLAAFYFLAMTWPEPGTAAKGRRAFPMLCGAACLFAAFITKGPVGLVIPVGAWGLYLVMGRRWKDLAAFALYAAITVSVLVLVYLVLIYAQGEWPLVSEVIENQVTGRVGTEPNRPWYYYTVYLLTSFSPWWLLAAALPWLAGKRFFNFTSFDALQFACETVKQEACCRELLNQCAAGLLFIFALFSMASSRHGRYLLPAFPFVAVLIAAGMSRLSCRIARVSADEGNSSKLAVFLKTGLLVILMAGTVASGLIINSVLVEPGISHEESGRDFIEKAERLIPSDMPIVIYRINPDGDGLKLALYSRKRSDALEFVRSPEILQKMGHCRFMLITYEKKKAEVEELLSGNSLKVISRGLVHKKGVVAVLVNGISHVSVDMIFAITYLGRINFTCVM